MRACGVRGSASRLAGLSLLAGAIASWVVARAGGRAAPRPGDAAANAARGRGPAALLDAIVAAWALVAVFATLRGVSPRLSLLGESSPVAALAEQADSAFAAAHRRAPADALILMDQARAELGLGRPDRALATSDRIVALLPDDPSGYGARAGSLLMLGRRAEARAALERARAAWWEEGSELQRAAVENMLLALDRADSARATNR